MKIADCNGYEIHLPTSGGKAGAGRNRTSTLQIRQNNNVVKQIRFVIADAASRKLALKKAKTFCTHN